MHTWTAKNRMQYCARQVDSMAVLQSKNDLRSNLKASNFLGEQPPDFLSLLCLCKLDVHVPPLLKILATGLFYEVI